MDDADRMNKRDTQSGAQLRSMRREYSRPPLHRSDLLADPLAQFQQWLNEAIAAQVPEPNAMTLATVAEDGGVSSRVVLLKELDQRGFVFFTNYQSRKGREIAADAHVALTFVWLELERQVRVRGVAKKLSRAASQAYFAQRPRRSQIAAWASAQSTPLASREQLEAAYAACETRFGTGTIPCPPYWGGYRVVPQEIEFWQGRRDRLHDRFVYTRGRGSRWIITRLAP